MFWFFTVFHFCHYTYMWKINWAFFGLPFQNWASISKSSFDFKMEYGASISNRASISKWSFDFKIEHQFQNGASISKWGFDFKMEKGASISKSSFNFEMELRFQNRASISKSNFDFKMEKGASISKWSFDFEIFHVTFWTEKRHVISVHVFLHLSILRFLSWPKASWPEIRREKDPEWWNETISKGSEISIKFERRLQSLIPWNF